MAVTVYELSRVGYREAYQLQTRILEDRVKGILGDTLLLLEHPHTVTVGKSGSTDNILVSPEELAARGIALFFIDRGGDVTYHGPGQLVGYPIIDLRARERDLHRYVSELEEVLIRTMSDFGITAGRDPGHRGVWVANREIAAIGLRVKKWVAMHGFALNVNTDLGPFSLINPCGFSDRGATSMAARLGHEIPMEKVTEKLLGHFAEVFGVGIEIGPANVVSKMLKEASEVLSHAGEGTAAVLV